MKLQYEHDDDDILDTDKIKSNPKQGNDNSTGDDDDDGGGDELNLHSSGDEEDSENPNNQKSHNDNNGYYQYGVQNKKNPYTENNKVFNPSLVKNGQSSRYFSEFAKTDMRDEENKLRYLKHIDYQEDKLSKQEKLIINETEVYFPFKPYQQQIDYMHKVIEACSFGQNALLESPTGTGKTLCLLTASLAWLKKVRESNLIDEKDLPKIIYCSRTHSQISQVMNELKHTVYKPKVCLIGSRDQLCVNPMVNTHKGMSLNSLCKKVREQRKDSPNCCSFFKNTGESVTPNGFEWGIQDVEDLHKLGSKNIVCPYYLQKSRIKYSDLILMPYNYLIDPKIRENFKVDYENSIIIMDEAHNVERVAEDVASFEIHVNQLHNVLCELHDLDKDFKTRILEKPDSTLGQNISEIIVLTNNFLNFLKQYNIRGPNPSKKSITDIKDSDGVYEGKEIFNIFFQGSRFRDYDRYNGPDKFEGLTEKNFNHWRYIFDKVLTELTEKQNGRPQMERWWDALKKVMRLYEMIYDPLKQYTNEKDQHTIKDEINHYYVYMRQEDIEFDKKKPYNEAQKDSMIRSARSLGFWCFNPGLGFKKIVNLNPRSLILTSGTLYPMASFQKELMMDFPITIENKHVISKEQANISILTNGIQGSEFNFAHKFRENEQQVEDLGETLLKITEVTPGGMLIFFPSYQMLHKLYEIWESTGLIKRLERFKTVLQEPRDSSHYKFVITSFYQSVYNKGAIIFAVCRGKISEGLDFSDDAARCVIIIGIPYPMTLDPKTILKKYYLDRNKNDGLSGQSWYCQQATRATNQAIGRVIRHVQDYGNIILIDKRFEQPTQRRQITSWLRDNVLVFQDASQAVQKYAQFFVEMKKRNFIPKVQQLAQVKLDFPEIDEDQNLKETVEHFKKRAREDQVQSKSVARKRTFEEIDNITTISPMRGTITNGRTNQFNNDSSKTIFIRETFGLLNIKSQEAMLKYSEIEDMKKAFGLAMLIRLFRQFLQLSLLSEQAYRKRFKQYLTIKDQSLSTKNHVFICRKILEILFENKHNEAVDDVQSLSYHSNEEELQQQFEDGYLIFLKKQLLAFMIKRVESYQAQQDFIVMIGSYMERMNSQIDVQQEQEAIKLDPEIVKNQLSQTKTYAQQINEKIAQLKQEQLQKQALRQSKKQQKSKNTKQRKKRQVNSDDDTNDSGDEYRPTPQQSQNSSSQNTFHSDQIDGKELSDQENMGIKNEQSELTNQSSQIRNTRQQLKNQNEQEEFEEDIENYDDQEIQQMILEQQREQDLESQMVSQNVCYRTEKQNPNDTFMQLFQTIAGKNHRENNQIETIEEDSRDQQMNYDSNEDDDRPRRRKKKKKPSTKKKQNKGFRDVVSFSRLQNSIPQENYNPVDTKKEMYSEKSSKSFYSIAMEPQQVVNQPHELQLWDKAFEETRTQYQQQKFHRRVKNRVQPSLDTLKEVPKICNSSLLMDRHLIQNALIRYQEKGIENETLKNKSSAFGGIKQPTDYKNIFLNRFQ